jgi:Fe-S oxidoreductase
MARDERFDLSVSKKNMEYAAEVAKNPERAGDGYKKSKIDPAYGDGKGNSHGRFDTPKTPLELNIEDAKNFKYDMDHCIKCKGCYWVEHTYNPGVKFNVRCPANLWNDFDAYGAMGKMRIGLGILNGSLKWDDKLLEIIYADPHCGACDVACKRNLDLEIELSLEALRVKACQDGAAPLPGSKKLIENAEKTGNSYGETGERHAWAKGLNIADKADTVYYVGDNACYKNPAIAQATAKILDTIGVKFMLVKDEKNPGIDAYDAGDIPTARKMAQAALDAVKATGAKTLVVSDGELYKAWKVDVPKTLNIATADLGFEVKHIIQLAAAAIEEGKLKFTKSVDARIAYHDCCAMSRTCDDWTPYKGERGWMGMIFPGMRRRRGRQGLYAEPRTILAAIPGADVTEFIRIRENAFCCSARSGVPANFPDLAQFAAGHRVDEAKECGIECIVTGSAGCKDNFNSVVSKADGVKAIDITELMAQAL